MGAGCLRSREVRRPPGTSQRPHSPLRAATGSSDSRTARSSLQSSVHEDTDERTHTAFSGAEGLQGDGGGQVRPPGASLRTDEEPRQDQDRGCTARASRRGGARDGHRVVSATCAACDHQTPETRSGRRPPGAGAGTPQGQRTHRPGTQQPAARSVPQARGPWGRAEAGLRCGRGAPGLQVLEKQRPVRAHGQEGTGLVEKKGDRKEGRRPRELLTREKRKERETGRQKRARSALRSPSRSRGHRGPDHPITGSLDHRGQRSLETDWGGLCRTLLGGQKGVLSSWDAAQASSHRLPGADSAEQQKAQHKVQPSPGTDHRAQRAGPRCSRVKCTQTTIKSRSQKHKSPPEMDQKQKQRHDMNLKQEMEEDKILITKHPRRAE